MQAPQETEKISNGAPQSFPPQEPTLVDLDTPLKMVGNISPFIQRCPDQDNAEPSGLRLTPLLRSNTPYQLPTPHPAPEELRDHRQPAAPPSAGANMERKTTPRTNKNLSQRDREPLNEPLTRAQSTKRLTKNLIRIPFINPPRCLGLSPRLCCPHRPP